MTPEGRIWTAFPVEFRAPGMRGKGKVRNVSDGGLFVGTREIPEEGAAVAVKLSPPGRASLEVTELVWWTATETGAARTRLGFGLRILDDDEGSYRRLVASLR